MVNQGLEGLSVVIVHYNGEGLIDQALSSLYAQKFELPLEVIVVDNSGNYSSQNKEVVISQGYNSGFARGVNAGIKKAKYSATLLMNQDAYCEDEYTLEKLYDQLQLLPEKTVLGCNLRSETNEFQESVWIDDPGLKREWRRGPINCKLFPHWKEKLEERKRVIHQKSAYVHRINGAFLMFRSILNQESLRFDEDFFLYGEDIEWALRIKKQGWKFYHFSDVVVKHVGSASSLNSKLKMNQIFVSDAIMLEKIHGKGYRNLFFALCDFNFKLEMYLEKRKYGDSQKVLEIRDSRSFLKEVKDKFKHVKSKDYFEKFNLYK